MYTFRVNPAAWAVTAALAAYMLWPLLALGAEEFFGPVDEPAGEPAAAELPAGEEPAEEAAAPEEGQAAAPPSFLRGDAWLDAGTFGLAGEPPEALPLHFQNWVLLEDVSPGPWLGDWRDLARAARAYHRSGFEEPLDRELMEYSYRVKREEEEFYAWEQERGLIPDVELGRESDIKFEGRKLFAVGYSKTTYPGGNPVFGGRQPAGDFAMEGELQLRIDGTVLRKTHVYVDYDDTRENETRNQVSVVYKGDPEELVQEAAFGDIILALPATEFVSYSSSRAVFGAKVDLKYKWARLMAIASREKGQTERATFTGGTELASITVPDTGYTRRKFFLLHTYYDADNDVTYFEGNRKIYTDADGLPKIEVFLYTPGIFPQGKLQVQLDAFEFDDSQGDGETPVLTRKYIKRGDPGEAVEACTRLARGTDYDVDVDTGVLSLKTPLAENQRLAVAYITADDAGNAKSIIGYREEGGTYRLNYSEPGSNVWKFNVPLKCLKNDEDGKALQRYEQKNYYYLGSTNIESTTLVVKVLDLNDNENDPLHEGRTYFYTLGLDRNGDGRVDTDFRDKTNSYIIVPDVEYNAQNNSFTRRDVGGWPKVEQPEPDGYLDNLPFDYVRNGVVEGKDAYRPDVESRRKFYFEYHSLKPSYFLHANVIPGSETVTLNGRILVPNQDYWLDYDSGFLEILTEDADDPTAVLEVTYEYKPLFALLAKSLVGGRFQLGPDDDRYLGTTLIAEFTSRPPGDQLPKLEEAPVDHYMVDADARYRFYPEFMTKLADAVPGAHTSEGSTFDLSAEFARSHKNVNTVGQALVDDMEGARQLSTLPMREEAWKPSSAPLEPGIDQSNRGNRLLELVSEPQHFLNDVDPNWPNDTLELLVVNGLPRDPEGNTPNPHRWGAIHHILSTTGLDFTESRFEYVEIMLNLGDVNGGVMHVDLGTISEDADGNRVRGSEPLDENGRLLPDFDNGYEFNNTRNQTEPAEPPDPPGRIKQLIDHKNRLDTEDNNANNYLDVDNDYFTYEVDFGEVLDNSSPYVVRGPASKDPKNPLKSGWYILRLPLEFDAADYEGDPDATRIRVLRFWFEAETKNDFPQGSSVTLGTVTFAAMRWEEPVLEPDKGLNQMKVSTKDSRHDGDYVPHRPVEDPETQTLEREQALVLQYILTDWDDVGVVGEGGGGGNSVSARWWGAGNNRYDTEDANHNGLLDPGEDVGVGPYRVGAGNGRLDEEPAPEGSTRFTGSGAQDFSRYGRLQFWYNNRTPHDAGGPDSRNDIVFLRFGADADNYYEYAVQLDGRKEWTAVDVDLERLLALHAKGQPFVERDEPIVYEHYRIVGDPSLLNVVEIRLGTRTKTPEDAGAGGYLDYREVWINDLLLLEPEVQLGEAMRAGAALDFGNFVKMNAGFRNVGAGFEEIGTTGAARSTTTGKNADATVELAKFMPDLWNVRLPLSGSVSKSETITEEKYDPKRSIYAQGRTVGVTRRAGLAFSKYKLPSGDFDYRSSDSVSYKYARTSESDTFSGGVDYDVYPRRRFLPANARTDFDRQYTKNTYNEKGKESSSTDWVSDDSRSSVKFEPAPDLEVTPSYDYGYTWDRKTEAEEAFDESYGLRVNYFRVKGLRPGTSYTSSYREDVSVSAEEGGGGNEPPGQDRGPNLRRGQTLDLSHSSSYNFSVPVDVGKLTDERARGINKWSLTPSYDLVRASSYTDMTARAPYRYRTGWEPVLPAFAGTPNFVNSRRRYSVTVNNRLNPLEFLGYRTGTRWENWDFIQADVDYSYSHEISNTTGVPSRIISTTFPDVTLDLYGTRNFPLVAAYLDRSTVVVSYYRKKTYQQDQDIEVQHKPGMSWRATWSRNFRTRADYYYTHTTTQDIEGDEPAGPERVLRQENPAFTVYYDIANPRGFKLPLLGTIRWRNELNLTAGVSYLKARGEQAEQDDTNEWEYSVSGGYYITTNLRADVTGTMTRFENLSQVADDYTTVGVNGNFEIIF